jgi:hypothetical protein
MKYYFCCPQCKSDESFKRVPYDSSVGFLLGVVGAWFAWLAHMEISWRVLSCNKCGCTFKQPPLPQSGAARVAMFLVVTDVAWLGIAYFSKTVPQLRDWVMDSPVSAHIAEWLGDHSILSVLALVVIALQLIIALIVYAGEAWRVRLDMRGRGLAVRVAKG